MYGERIIPSWISEGAEVTIAREEGRSYASYTDAKVVKITKTQVTVEAENRISKVVEKRRFTIPKYGTSFDEVGTKYANSYSSSRLISRMDGLHAQARAHQEKVKMQLQGRAFAILDEGSRSRRWINATKVERIRRELEALLADFAEIGELPDFEELDREDAEKAAEKEVDTK